GPPSAAVPESAWPARPAGSGGRLRRRADHLAAVVIAAGRADVMRPLGLAAVRALDMRGRRQGVVGPAHVTARLGNLLLRNCHWFSLTLRSRDVNGVATWSSVRNRPAPEDRG